MEEEGPEVRKRALACWRRREACSAMGREEKGGGGGGEGSEREREERVVTMDMG